MKNEKLIKLTPGQIATLVCQLEVTAPKPGNVHRAADFEDATMIDFLNSGVALGHVIDASLNEEGGENPDSIGSMILAAVGATTWVTDTNTNLGIILLLCPLAHVYARSGGLDSNRLTAAFSGLTAEDARDVYAAISKSKASGLQADSVTSKVSPVFDVSDPETAPGDLLAAMNLAAPRDMIAMQYTNGLADVFDFVLPAILEGHQRLELLSSAIIYAHVKTMAEFPDSLIGRKLGQQTAIQSAGYAQRAMDQFSDCDGDYSPFWDSVSDLDFWLRSDHHRRNPGTTADLVTAALFVGVATGKLTPPFR